MKDVVHHMKYLQKKVIRSARKNSQNEESASTAPHFQNKNPLKSSKNSKKVIVESSPSLN